MKEFNINFLDHVAIRVKDIDISVEWYEKVIGLKKCLLPEWKNYPVLMLAGKSGIAIFPANMSDPSLNKHSRNIKIDHFAFNVSNEDFEKAKRHYEKIEQEFEFQDHFYFHSIYTKDPDGHTVELTTIIVDENSVYK
jgi:catechol 2,3-dioxygenase-like lactoylglutathione lyase family enzyme